MEGVRQSSGALIFPASPSELKAIHQRKELEKEIEEVKALKEELKAIIEEAKKE